MMKSKPKTPRHRCKIRLQSNILQNHSSRKHICRKKATELERQIRYRWPQMFARQRTQAAKRLHQVPAPGNESARKILLDSLLLLLLLHSLNCLHLPWQKNRDGGKQKGQAFPFLSSSQIPKPEVLWREPNPPPYLYTYAAIPTRIITCTEFSRH